MNRPLFLLYVAASLGLGTATVLAADVTLTTYYPSPTGNYQTLNTNTLNWGTDTNSPSNILGTDQGGDIELGAYNNVRANPIVGGRPYLDFHFGNGTIEDYNARIINDANNRLQFATASGGNVLSISASNVGIGTTSAIQKLEVVGDVFSRATSATARPYMGVVAHDWLTTPSFRDVHLQYIGSGVGGNLLTAPTTIANSMAGILAFQNTSNAVIMTNGQTPLVLATWSGEAMRIHGVSRNVGIGGLTDPQARLAVRGNGTGDVRIGAVECGGNYSGITLNGQAPGDCATNATYNILSSPTDPDFYLNRPAGRTMRFREANNGDQMVIRAGGNVGVGLANPNGKLAVQGEGAGYAAIGSAACGGDYTGIALNGRAMNCSNYNLLSVSGATPDLFINRPNGGNIYFRKNNVDQVTIDLNGNLGVSNTAPAFKVDVNGDIRTSGKIGTNGFGPNSGYPAGWGGGIHTFDIYSEGTVGVGLGGALSAYMTTGDPRLQVNGNANITGNVTAAAFFYNSDGRLKQNIRPLGNALEKLEHINGVSFEWKKNGEKGVGVTAQDVEKVFPELVNTGKDGMKSVEYGNLTAVLIEAVKEQQKQIEALKKQVAQLEAHPAR